MAASLDIELMRGAIRAGRVIWQRHALERLMERGILRSEVIDVLLGGERIEDYPEDWPWPSALFLTRGGVRPLHVVASHHEASDRVAVITAYEPTLDRFEADLRTRRTKP